MVIGFDIDDTITRHPQFFAVISKALVAAGHRVIIITFREDRDSAEAELRKWGIAYDGLMTSSLDTALEHGVDEWKAEACRQHGVEVFFEDDPAVLSHLDDSVVAMMPIREDRKNLPDGIRCRWNE